MNDKKISFYLPKRGQKNLIEDYINQEFPQQEKIQKLKTNDQLQEEQQFIDMINENPEDYFNFGMNMNDFKMFIFKQLYMRVERDQIKKQIDIYRQNN